MADERKSKLPLVLGGAIAVCVIGAVLVAVGPGWASFGAGHLRRLLSPEQNPEGSTYEATAKGPVSLADFVHDGLAAWPGADVRAIHDAAGELATGLLHRGDIEVGSIEQGKFVPWPMPRWQAAEKITAELSTMNSFLLDKNRYVFRRKPAN